MPLFPPMALHVAWQFTRNELKRVRFPPEPLVYQPLFYGEKHMKKLMIIGLCFVLGVVLSVSVADAQVSVRVGPVQVQTQTQAPGSYMVQPPAYRVRVPAYYYVQPRPYMVTPVVKPRPPKPNFWTPIRNKIWRHNNRPSVRYIITPQ